MWSTALEPPLDSARTRTFVPQPNSRLTVDERQHEGCQGEAAQSERSRVGEAAVVGRERGLTLHARHPTEVSARRKGVSWPASSRSSGDWTRRTLSSGWPPGVTLRRLSGAPPSCDM